MNVDQFEGGRFQPPVVAWVAFRQTH